MTQSYQIGHYTKFESISLFNDEFNRYMIEQILINNQNTIDI